MSIPVILASTSPYRKQILAKLDFPFSCCDPRVDETHLINESPKELVLRLAEAKAKAGALAYPEGLVIGSDQVAVIEGKIVGKPLNHETAVKQLMASSGKIITFYTGISLHNIASSHNESLCETFKVHFKHLSQQQIENYLSREQPYFCAGSFKCEGLGIALFERLEGKDPNTLIGLPLITLTEMLDRQDYDVLAQR
ncbi:MAF protein [Shewanella psychrophila]|uniref:7-methyl-GTP pyrophosphatase n=1 Tax=Shewanella psychrophila TaxID=225848 RepID=A0A1S6HLY2_9GAMM|nr:nucleoside triphosphate pyrophosphatase [Shewanella psychrophila]AQS36536.1 MAF protein [Shewanella psychrophila]